MKLDQYITENGIALDDLAHLIGDVSVSGVRKWARGERVPRPDQMRRIAVVTHGRVLPNDFILPTTVAAE